MKPSFRYSKVLVVLLALALAQSACNFGAQPAGGTPQQAPSQALPVDQPTPTKGERGTPEEAQAMLERAIADYNEVGAKQAHADFNDKNGAFIDRDLYVVCMGADHLETANGGFPQYVGTSADLLSDVHGNPLGKSVWDAASADQVASVDYHWVNPVSGQTEPKTIFFQKIGEEVCGVGAYIP